MTLLLYKLIKNMDNLKKEIKGYYRTYNCGRESRRWVCASFFAVIVFGVEKSGVIFWFLACRDLGEEFWKTTFVEGVSIKLR